MSKSESEKNLAATKKVFTAIVVVAILLVIVLALLLIVTLTSGGFERGTSTAPDNVIADESGSAAGVKKTNNGVVITSDMIEYLSLSMWNSDTDYRFVAENLFPGDTETRVYEVTIKNSKIKAVAFGIELKSTNTLLADVLEVYIYEASTGKILYDGMMSGLMDPVSVAVPNGCQKLQYEITVSLSTSVGNEYANLSLSADFCWSVDDAYVETEPGTDTTEPGTDTTEPGTDTTEPGTDTTEPGTETTEPGTDTTEPGTDTTEPGTDTTEPGTDTTEPGTDTTEPGTDTTEPDTTNDGNACDSNGDGVCDCLEGECNCDVDRDGICDCGICNDECACGCHGHSCDADGDGHCDCDPDADCDCEYDCAYKDCDCLCCPWCFGICPLCWMIPLMVAEATIEKMIALVIWQILRRREKSDE